MAGRVLKFVLLALLSFVLVTGCVRSPLKSPDQAMRPMKAMPELVDDLDFATLADALEANIKQLRSQIKPGRESLLSFGPTTISKSDYLRALEFLLGVARMDSSGATFRKSLESFFQPYEVYGGEGWGEVFITSYFEPVLSASRERTEQHSQPLYAMPEEMKSTIHRTLASVLDQPELRLVSTLYDRARIDDDLVLQGRGLEIAWVDPIDAFFLQIQGSGVVQFNDGTQLNVGYAAQNGFPYVPIGRFLLDVIPKEKMSLQQIERYLRSSPESERRRLMNMNPSYVFFRPLETSGITYFGTEVVPGRTVATDKNLFPKGTLAFLEFEKPRFAKADSEEPAAWEKASRFVLDQDTGGAIRGPHRVDLFWGRGEEAKQAAGVMKNPGRLVYFVPRPDLLARLRENDPSLRQSANQLSSTIK